jgi:membrane protein insertase Oxa1/YidC/SpoIIIJ
MQAMQRHMPEMKAIQQKYKTDKKRQQGRADEVLP